jgi:hypothetical protein
VINTGMLPHQCSAFTEGLFGPMHSEFERTPKKATVTSGAPLIDLRDRPAAPKAYVVAEAWYVAHQLAWAALFAANGFWFCAVGAAYGDDARDRGRGTDEETDAVLRGDPDVRGQVLMDTAT